MQRSARPTALLLACLLVAATSCSGGSDDDEEADATPSPSATTTQPETTTTLDPEQAEREAVIAAYEAAREAQAESSAPPNPDPNHPDLAATHTGFMLDHVVAIVEGLERTGAAYRLPEESQYRTEVDSVRFDDVEGQQVAFLEVCTVTDEEQIVVATGAVIRSGLQTLQASAAMRDEGGVWKLAEYRVNQTMEGLAGCAVD